MHFLFVIFYLNYLFCSHIFMILQTSVLDSDFYTCELQSFFTHLFLNLQYFFPVSAFFNLNATNRITSSANLTRFHLLPLLIPGSNEEFLFPFLNNLKLFFPLQFPYLSSDFSYICPVFILVTVAFSTQYSSFRSRLFCFW